MTTSSIAPFMSRRLQESMLCFADSNDQVEQIKGAAIAPKRAVDVMAAEIAHMLILIKNAIVPLPICVPRKVSA